MTPFYRHLSGIPGFGVQSDIDKVGAWATVGVGAAFATHGLISLAKHWKQGQPPRHLPEPPEKPPENPAGEKGERS
jgi:hypothetical protein